MKRFTLKPFIYFLFIYILGFVLLLTIERIGSQGKQCIDYCIIPFEYYGYWLIGSAIVGIPISIYKGFKK